MWKRIAVLSLFIVLLSSFSLYAQSQEDTAPTISISDIETLQIALTTILSLSQDNQTEFTTLNKVLENWKKGILELPQKQKEQLTLSIRVRSLESENLVLKIGVGVVTVVAIGEGIYIAIKQ